MEAIFKQSHLEKSTLNRTIKVDNLTQNVQYQIRPITCSILLSKVYVSDITSTYVSQFESKLCWVNRHKKLKLISAWNLTTGVLESWKSQKFREPNLLPPSPKAVMPLKCVLFICEIRNDNHANAARAWKRKGRTRPRRARAYAEIMDGHDVKLRIWVIDGVQK